MRFAPNIKLAMQRSFVDFLEGKKIVPTNIELSLTGVCNGTCPWCFYSKKQSGLTLHLYDAISLIDELAEMKVKSITYTGGGEPTLHPSFKTITKYAAKKGIKQGLITNAILKPKYDPKLFEWIRVSATPTPLNKNNLRILRKCKTLGICVNDVGNDQDIEHTLKIAEEVKADYVQIRPALNTNGQITNLNPPNIKHPLLERTLYKYEEAKHKHTYKKCYGYHFVPFIWEDGGVYVCAYHRGDKNYYLGNVLREDFAKIMKRTPKSVPVINTCQVCCKNHEINKVVNAAFEIKDGDFI